MSPGASCFHCTSFPFLCVHVEARAGHWEFYALNWKFLIQSTMAGQWAPGSPSSAPKCWAMNICSFAQLFYMVTGIQTQVFVLAKQKLIPPEPSSSSLPPLSVQEFSVFWLSCFSVKIQIYKKSLHVGTRGPSEGLRWLRALAAPVKDPGLVASNYMVAS